MHKNKLASTGNRVQLAPSRQLVATEYEGRTAPTLHFLKEHGLMGGQPNRASFSSGCGLQSQFVVCDWLQKEVTEAAVDPLEVKCTDPILSQVLAEDKDYSCDVTLNYRHINVGHELASQGILDQAVALWSSALNGCSSGWSALLRDLVEGWFLEQVKVVAEVYASSFRVSL